jgi:hypothetical protein
MGTFTYKISYFNDEIEIIEEHKMENISKEDAEFHTYEMRIGDFGADFFDFKFDGEPMILTEI